MNWDRVFFNIYQSRTVVTPLENSNDKWVLEIPINITTNSPIEIPTFIYNAFCLNFDDLFKRNDDSYRKIRTLLFYDDQKPYYKTADAIIREALPQNRFTKVRIKPSEPIYYIGNGMVVTENLKVVMVCSFELAFHNTSNSMDNYQRTLNSIKPVFRIDRDFFNSRGDSIQRHITGKCVSEVLKMEIYDRNFALDGETVFSTPTVIIGEIPYSHYSLQQPSINHTDDVLKSIVLTHIEEI